MTPKIDINMHKKNIYSYNEKTMTPEKLMQDAPESPVGRFKSTAGMDDNFTPKKRLQLSPDQRTNKFNDFDDDSEIARATAKKA